MDARYSGAVTPEQHVRAWQLVEGFRNSVPCEPDFLGHVDDDPDDLLWLAARLIAQHRWNQPGVTPQDILDEAEGRVDG